MDFLNEIFSQIPFDLSNVGLGFLHDILSGMGLGWLSFFLAILTVFILLILALAIIAIGWDIIRRRIKSDEELHEEEEKSTQLKEIAEKSKPKPVHEIKEKMESGQQSNYSQNISVSAGTGQKKQYTQTIPLKKGNKKKISF